MSERQRPTAPERTIATGSDPFGDFFDQAEPSGELVVVQHGIFTERLPLAGRTVGEIRRMYGDRFDIPPEAPGRVGGQDVDDATVVRPGERIEFGHDSGEKGGRQEVLFPQVAPRSGYTVFIEGAEVCVRSTEGTDSRRPLREVLGEVGRDGPDSCGILPEGTRAVLGMPNGGQVVVHQTPPRMHTFKWIAPDSPAPFGEGTQYRRVHVALPYLVVLAVFQRDNRGRLALTDKNEAFFTTRPLCSLDDALCLPALLNVSSFQLREGHCLAWICTQHLKRPKREAGSGEDLYRARCVQRLHQHLLDGGFNQSSEHHEGSSWFGETVKRKVDPRLESVESWEHASAENPAFVLDVDWIPTGLSLGQVAQRIRGLQFKERKPTANEVARCVLNGKLSPREKGDEA